MCFKKLLFVMVMAGSMVISSSSVFAQMGQGHDVQEWKEKWDAERQKIYDALDLTEAQKKALDQNKIKSREARKSAFEQMAKYTQQMNEELKKSELDMTKIQQIQSQLKGVQAQLLDGRLNGILEIRKILTAEQFVKFSEVMNEDKPKMK